MDQFFHQGVMQAKLWVQGLGQTWDLDLETEVHRECACVVVNKMVPTLG